MRRAEGPGDRGRVIIEPCYKRMGQMIGPLFEPMGRAAAELYEKYTTEELAVIRDFTARPRPRDGNRGGPQAARSRPGTDG